MTNTEKNSLTEFEKQILEIEAKKLKSLEKIANSLDAFTIWVEEIDKEDWSERIQFYLSEFLSRQPKLNKESDE
jgi:hypothetical protein